MERQILHSDLDNFYASVECLENPELVGKPVAVCGAPEARCGIVLAKNQQAKEFGVKTGETIWQAKKKCPHLVTVLPRHRLYGEYSERVFEIYRRFTDQVEPFGVDEAWMDVTGSGRLFGDGEKIAHEIRAVLKKEIGLTASVGVSFNKTCAKLASDLKKPNAVCVIPRERYEEVVWPLPVGSLLFVGRKTRVALARYGLYTVGDLARADLGFLRAVFGKFGERLYEYANGSEEEPVRKWDAREQVKSIGNSVTLPHDVTEETDVYRVLYWLCDYVTARMRRVGLCGKTVSVWVRNADFYSYERQCTLGEFTAVAEPVMEAVMGLYRGSHTSGQKIRSLGVRVTNLRHVEISEQMSFFAEEQKKQRYRDLADCTDNINRRFGSDTIKRALLLS